MPLYEYFGARGLSPWVGFITSNLSFSFGLQASYLTEEEPKDFFGQYSGTTIFLFCSLAMACGGAMTATGAWYLGGWPRVAWKLTQWNTGAFCVGFLMDRRLKYR